MGRSRSAGSSDLQAPTAGRSRFEQGRTRRKKRFRSSPCCLPQSPQLGSLLASLLDLQSVLTTS
jgi:hypothetical protein